MRDKIFLDTNLLIYLYSESETDKRDTVCRIFDSNYCVTSIQALNEACNVWLKKYGWDGAQVCKHLDNIHALCDEILTVNRSTINIALSLKDRYGYSYYDCLILSSALEGNCNVIMTEDMNHGQIISDYLKISNPFVNSQKNTPEGEK